jgi:AcrR family transcriptional regulator
MARWAADAAGRLHNAALELFIENGFAATTVPQITERAGLTTRSFFRYFADKREVLFTGEDELPAVVAEMFDQADLEQTPMEIVHHGLRNVVTPRLKSFRNELLVRRQIVHSDDGLRERELRKLAILHSAATAALIRRGLTPLDAEIMGRLAVTIYDTTLELWLAQDAPDSLDAILDSVVEAVGRIASPAQQRD